MNHLKLTVYLAGEIHSDWRDQIRQGIEVAELPVTILTPVTDHDASDLVGVRILGDEEKAVWQDHKAARINSIRIKAGIEQADIVVVKFGETYRQWNAAFDAGYAVAKGKALITIHPPEISHPLKEINAAAMATAENAAQVVEILKYLIQTT